MTSAIQNSISSDSNDSSIVSQNEDNYGHSTAETKMPNYFCDVCNSTCFLMNGRRRKLQARYEGFVLVKRIHGYDFSSKFLLSSCVAQDSLNVGHKPGASVLGGSATAISPSAYVNKCPSYDRRHSCGDILDGDNILNSNLSASEQGKSVVISGNAAQQECISRKLVNVSSDKVNISNIITDQVNCEAENYKDRKQFIGNLINSHQRLSRKKSRSQDTLVTRRIKTNSVENNDRIILNNQLISPIYQLSSTLSRSEGNILNVTSTHSLPLTAPEILGTGNLKVDELVKLPKKLLDRVSDEVGQFVFNLERWKEEYVVLTQTSISIRMNNGKFEVLLPYSMIEDVQPLFPCAISGHQHCLFISGGRTSLLMQATTPYVRDQWLHTIIWKKNAYKYKNLLKTARRPEVLLKELKNLVEMSLTTPLHDHSVCEVPLELASSILTTNECWMSRHTNEEIIVTLAPLLENNKPSAEICSFFSRHCSDNPRSRLVIDMFTPVVSRILKHNVDFGKYPYVRQFVQDYIQALNSQNDGQNVVHKFICDTHGSGSHCPHLRVLPNLMAVCTSAIFNLLEMQRNSKYINLHSETELNHHLQCYISVLRLISEYDDWRPGLAQILQPVPFPDFALADESFMRELLPIIRAIGTDTRCLVHQMVIGPREHKEGWLHFISPSSISCCDKGETWTAILQVLLSCCYKRKKFLRMLLKSLGSCMLLALRDNCTAQEILCLMLEWRLVEGSDQCMQIISTLQSSPSGKKKYQMLRDKQLHLQELQQKCGPRKLTLPSRSTDSDVMRFLSSGPFGNLEVLSLAFTRVTSACADQLIHLQSLRYLNLWATQFGDSGLQQICEHLINLQTLNLCETPITDKGISAIPSLKNLRSLNLNSTKLSLQMFEELKKALPSLQEVDVRYTDAW